MAIVKIQAPLAGIRGKYGGMVFSANGSANYVKQWCMPVDRRSAAQVLHRSWLAMVRHGWGQLTQAQIDAWDALAATPPEVDYNSLGEVVLLSGSAWHARINLRQLACGQAYNGTAPANVAVDPPTAFGLQCYTHMWLGRTDYCTFGDGDFAGYKASLDISVSSSLVLQGKTTGYYLVKRWHQGLGSSQDITAAVAATLGWLVVGNRLYGRLWKRATTGIRSVPLEVVADILPEP